mgnify:CR=1 FL=1
MHLLEEMETLFSFLVPLIIQKIDLMGNHMLHFGQLIVMGQDMVGHILCGWKMGFMIFCVGLNLSAFLLGL